MATQEMDLEEFAFRISRLGESMQEAIERRIVGGASGELLEELPGLTPELTGELRSRWRRTRSGDTAVIENMADHAGLIIPGRRRSKRSGRMLGSKKTGRGDIVRKALKAADADIDRVIEQVLGKL